MNRIDKGIGEAERAVTRVMDQRETCAICGQKFDDNEEHICTKRALDACVAKLKELYDYFDDRSGVDREALRKCAEITEVLERAGAL